MYFEYFLAAALIGLLVLVFVITNRKKKLSPEVAQRAVEDIDKTRLLDPAHAVLEAHKIFVFTLATLVSAKRRKKIRAAETVALFAKRFPNTDSVWKSHRLRNRIAHEPNINVTNTHADLARRDFVRALQSISK